MALMKCPECGATVSSAAKACPGCGYPIAESPTPVVAKPVNVQPLLVVQPSWWNYFGHLMFAWLLIPWLIAWLRRKSTVLRVYDDRIVLERGVLTKEYREFFIRDIRAIDIDQSLFGRMLHIGNLTISTAATVDAAEELTGIPHPHRVRDLIVAHRQAS